MRLSMLSQSTWWPSKSGPSTHTNRILPPTETRQPPHMPVPSIMIVLSETIVGMPKGFVVAAQNFIMIGGPIAITRSGGVALSQSSLSGAVTRSLRPYEPSSVQTITSSEAARMRSSKMSRSFVRAARMLVTWLPAAFIAWAIGWIGATPMPPPQSTTRPNLSTSLGMPSGPRTSARASPTPRRASLSVEAPTAWKTTVTVPAASSASAMVSGTRSPQSWSTWTMRNWPALCSRAMCGASKAIS